MQSRVAHTIKHRKAPNDEFTTPAELAKLCINLVPLQDGDVVLDAAVGSGAFYNNYPTYVKRQYTDASDLFLIHSSVGSVDWIITNPPYSNLDSWIVQSCQVCRKGFAYLLGVINLTPKRIEIANKSGFGLTTLYLVKVYKWFGISCFVIFQKGRENIIGYNREVWR